MELVSSLTIAGAVVLCIFYLSTRVRVNLTTVPQPRKPTELGGKITLKLSPMERAARMRQGPSGK